jgi:hypothetical protein
MKLPPILVVAVALATITLTACTYEAQQPWQRGRDPRCCRHLGDRARSKGFTDGIKRCNGGIKIGASQPADFLPDKGLQVMETILQARRRSTRSTPTTTTWPWAWSRR